MQTLEEYLSRTESASRMLLRAIDSYLDMLRAAPVPVFMTSTPPGKDHDREVAEWLVANREQNAQAQAASQSFTAESFALSTLCGAVLQVAAKAIECFSTNPTVPAHLGRAVGPKVRRYCVGRLVRSVPLGLVVYAARNQHTHFNDEQLREPSVTVFELLATEHEYKSTLPFRDPPFDLENPGLVSFAANVTALLGWRDYDTYVADMRAL